MAELNLDELNRWLGREQTAVAVLAAETANLMNATLDREATFKDGDLLPPAWHWLYFHEAIGGRLLGVEGHPELGRFMPPVSYGGGEPPRRMWAGGSFRFERPLRLGETATKVSRIKAITPKEGRSGRLCFVIVEHEVFVEGERCLWEEQTIVYREPAKAGAAVIKPVLAAVDGAFSASYQPDPIMLFRYSALTFNGHRIHYDVDFCREHEGYPGLVVHGPLIATLLLDLVCQRYPERRLATYTYRGRSPLFNPHPFTVQGKLEGDGGTVWASDHEGGLAMMAELTFA